MAKGKKKEPLVNAILKRLYYNPRSASSYGSKATLQKGLEQDLKKTKKRIKRKNLASKVKTWLQDQTTYTLHKQPQKTFPRRQVIVSGINDQWQADLADMQLLADENQGYRYILIVIDCFSRKAWARALQDKSGKSVADAFNDIFNTQEPPNKLQTDKGREFYNKDLQTLLQKKGVKLFSTEDPVTKACMAERLIRTIKGRLYKYFHAKKTFKWVDVLQDIIDSYNNRRHSLIKMTPNQVNENNTHIVRENNLHRRGKAYPKQHKATFKAGDIVRIVTDSHVFKKKYLPRWSEEMFKVKNVRPTQPVVYALEDLNGEGIKGTFYAPELQKVTSLPEVWEIESIVDEKKNKVLVKWKGYPDSMNQWIHKKAIQQL
jgi:transposase InsO family protein/ribosomal protein L21E